MSGTCGIITPILAFISISLAIGSFPQFNWMNNALSDLGIVPGVTSVVFNCGLMASGVMGFIFATGLFMLLKKSVVGSTATVVFALATIALISVGVFPESVRPVHYLVSVAFFVLLPISLIVVTGAFWLAGQVRMAIFTLTTAFATAIPWILHFSIHYVAGVAIPEIISALAVSIWVLVASSKMLSAASQAKTS